VFASVGGCSSDPSTGEGEVGQTTQALKMTKCSSKTGCCKGGEQAFDTSDPFEAQLFSWGCSLPVVYSPNPSMNAYWFYSVCTDPGRRVESFLSAHPTYQQSPYSAQVTTSLNPDCAPAPPAGSVDVVWDPTCSTCRTN
jgi:hypothetical protein